MLQSINWLKLREYPSLEKNMLLCLVSRSSFRSPPTKTPTSLCFFTKARMMEFSTPSGGGGGASGGISSLELKPTTESIHFATPPITEGTSRRYEMQKRRDMKTFLQYLKNHEPPLLVARCGDEEIIDFLKHMDQFGKTKMHLSSCEFFGKSNIPKAPLVLVACDCPLKQAWGSLDSLVGRLRAAFEENGGNPESNPFGTKIVRMYLKQVKEEQAKARGIQFDKKRKKSGAIASSSTVIVTKGIPDINDVVDGRSDVGGAGVCTSNAGGVLTIQGIPSEKKRKQPTTSCPSMSMKGPPMVDGGGYDGGGCGTGHGGEGGYNGPDVCCGDVSTSVAGGVATVEVSVSTPDTDGIVSVEKTNMRFVARTPVEVSIRDKQCPGAWFPATILKEIDSRLFLVGYQSLRLGDAEGCSKEIVDSLHIRPSRPDSVQRKEFNVLEKVDVYYDGGWWSGQITEVLASNRYLVHFKHQKIRREFNLFELRCHMEWVNGKWVQDSLMLMTRETTETSLLTAIPEKEITTISHPAQELSDHPPSNVGVEDCGNVVDFDRFGSHPIMEDLNVSPCISIEEDQCDSSKTLLQCSEQNFGLQSLPDSTVIPDHQKTSGQQKCKHRGTRWCCHEMALSGNQYCEKHLLEQNIHQEKKRKRPREQSCVPVDVFQPSICSNKKGTFVDASLSPLSTFKGAQCDSSKSQLQFLENDPAVQPHSRKGLGNHDLDTEHNQVDVRSDQAHLLLPCNSADIGTESNTRNQQIEQPTLKSNNSEILPPFEMVKTGKTTGTSLVLIENGEQEMTTDPSPSEGLRYPAPSFGVEYSDNVLNTDGFGSDPIDEFSISPPSNVKGQCDTSRTEVQSRTKVQCSQETLTLQSSPDNSEQQRCIRKSARWHCSQMALPGKQHCEKHLLDQSIRNEKRRKRPGEKIRLSVGPFLPLVQQQCRRTGTGWRCHEMALPEKRYCEKHQLIKDIYNEKRRKNTRKPSRFSVGPFLPSVQQQCRRTGTGWRCHEMALLGKRYCEKHQLGKDIYNEKRRKKERTSNENAKIVKTTSIGGVGEGVDLEGEGTDSTSTRPEGM